MAGSLLLALPSYAQAACTAPASTVTCTGDVSAGASFGAPVDVLNVNSLTVNAGAISLNRTGGPGGNGSSDLVNGDSGDGGTGGSGATVNYTGGASNINTANTGITAISNGGNGGSGGDGIGITIPIPVPPFVVPLPGFGGSGGAGGNGGAIFVNSTGSITVTGDSHHGILAESYAGNGGNGGNSISILSVYGEGGSGGQGGAGGSVMVTSSGAISTNGADAYAIFATSRGGIGGNGGDAGGLVATGGAGAGTGPGGDVTVVSSGSILTQGASSHGIFAQSVGGFAGNGGSGGGLVAFGGSGESAGVGGTVIVTNNATITTMNSQSYGILAQSIGGGGGAGGSGGGLVSLGGTGDAGGGGGTVTVTNNAGGNIHTFGVESSGIVAQSIGGGGGDGGGSGGLVGIGGSGSTTSAGGNVTVSNAATITTESDKASAIFAQSIGGGGGNGGTGGGLIAIGGTGGGGGAGGIVKVFQTGILSTGGADSSAIFAQSIGGGGGNGGNAYAGGLGGSLAIGGSGAGGGAGGAVTINETSDVNTLTSSTIMTGGDRSHGIQAQSIGGGGGNGGLAVAGSISDGFSAAFALGGSAAAGGAAGAVTVNEKGFISTGGAQASGIFAQSVGGGGGTGGGSVAASPVGGFSLGFSMGGTGGPGGSGDAVIVNAQGNIITTGAMSNGIFAQSVGGGGGNGGFAISAAAGAGALSIGLGGSGGIGGTGGAVTVNTFGTGFFAPGINTTGQGAVGILAQSVGGGGGNGGFAITGSAGVVSVAASVGGAGGAGANGGTVTVNNTIGITTLGDLGYGILAQSVGGGGGNGGFAVSGALGISVEDIPGGAAAISVGGKGGGASNSDLVTVVNSGNIDTTGLGAHGIFAQSIGGGGGSGGFAGSLAMTLGTGAAFGVSVGGTGGGGGNAGGVDVTNTGASIITRNNGSYGILAQSIGGGGGDGGFAFSGAFGFGGEVNVNVSVAVGGHGGSGGTGGNVDVDNSSTITTMGAQSYGILAQSIGGGGGTGGLAVSGTLGLSENPGNVGVTVGGFGGSGATAGMVQVTNSGAIVTGGQDAIAILAQSIGGSGGNGGMAITAQLTGATKNSAALGVAVGGSGGDGNSAGEVDVTNTSTGTINTGGVGAHGIEAQSIGGGGGNGGMSLVAQLGIAGGSKEQASKTLNVGVSVGGGAGDGGFGGTVHVINAGAIDVTGETSMGIFAQSVGGGGGNGGGAINALGMKTDSTNPDSRTVNAQVTIGGGGGNGNNGGAVTVDNSGSITTHGGTGYGVFAQSVGGGGGIGGRANTLSLVFADKCSIPLLCTAPASNKNNWNFGVTLGGNGGGASNGGSVTVNNTGQVTTFGASSDGIYAQSIGGGGGNGGTGVLGSAGILPVPVELLFLPVGSVAAYRNLQVTVGGSGGSSGDGGTVTVDNDKNITTHGDVSNGIFAQSVGGGGGVAGDAAVGLTGIIGVGGKGGSAGKGGDVTINQHGGATIETFGVASNGIFAESIGGGGGLAGNVKRGLAGENVNLPGTGLTVPKLNIGLGVALGMGGGGGGDGGHVSVTFDGSIITHGDNATGIFAHSIGGGGGVLGELGNDVPVLSLLSWHIGSNGDAGNGGVVDVTQNGTIQTAGNNAHGIFAQSQGGTGTAGNVNVTINSGSILTGSILAAGDGTAAAPLRGLGSIGILAQSAAVDNANNGNITISVNNANSVVQGGRTMALDANTGYVGVGIMIEDGKTNTITNNGLVTTLGGVNSGFAILATGSDATHPGGDEAVSNFGTVTGSFDLGAGNNSFVNQATGVLNSGAIANVGAGNTLTNLGTFSPGGAANVFTTAVTGNFSQAATARYALDLDFKPNTADRINVTGTSSVKGTVAIGFLNTGSVQTGSHTVTILSSAGGVTDHTGLALNVASSAVATYGLQYPNANDIVLGYSIDFQPLGLPPNLQSLGGAINLIQANGGTPGFAPIAARLFALPNTASLITAYTALAGEGAVATQHAAFEAGNMFTGTTLDQTSLWFGGNDSGGVSFADEPDGALQYAAKPKSQQASDAFAQFNSRSTYRPDRWRLWMSGFGGRQSIDGDASFGTASVTQSVQGGAFGIDRQINGNYLFGVSLGGSHGSFSVPDRATNGNLDGTHVALYGITRQNDWYVSGVLSYAHYGNEVNRFITGVGPTENAHSLFGSNQLSGRVEFGQRHEFGRVALTPFASIQFDQLWTQRYSENTVVVGTGTPGILGLTYGSQMTTSVPGSLGLQAESRYVFGNGMMWTGYGRVAWVHDFQADRSVTPAFNVAPDFSFVTSGAKGATDSAQVKLGVNLNVSQHSALFASVNSMLASTSHSYAITGGYRVGW